MIVDARAGVSILRRGRHGIWIPQPGFERYNHPTGGYDVSSRLTRGMAQHKRYKFLMMGSTKTITAGNDYQAYVGEDTLQRHMISNTIAILGGNDHNTCMRRVLRAISSWGEIARIAPTLGEWLDNNRVKRLSRGHSAHLFFRFGLGLDKAMRESVQIGDEIDGRGSRTLKLEYPFKESSVPESEFGGAGRSFEMRWCLTGDIEWIARDMVFIHS